MTSRMFGLQMSNWRRIVATGVCVAGVMLGGLRGVAAVKEFAPEAPTLAPGVGPCPPLRWLLRSWPHM